MQFWSEASDGPSTDSIPDTIKETFNRGALTRERRMESGMVSVSKPQGVSNVKLLITQSRSHFLLADRNCFMSQAVRVKSIPTLVKIRNHEVEVTILSVPF